MSPPKAGRRIADEVPWSDHVNDYDRAHFDIYLRVLDATDEGADPEEIIEIVLNLDPVKEPGRGRKMLESHLRRARWMSKQGFWDLIRH
ncbi:MAG: hypothetical protein BGO51_16190 [Rhodospirillales bacterium 69-11]|nr:MAG: hypothetical protein BGO51_16190 [Rhodospirillales bacterium 69-11]